MFLNIKLYHSNFISKICPNCGKILIKISKRKFICPYCKNDIYYRSTPENHTELLLSTSEKEIYEFYKSSFYEFNREYPIKTLLCSELYPNDAAIDKISKDALPSTFIPIILEKKSTYLKNNDLGLYAGSLSVLGYLYAINHEYDTAFNFFAFKTHLFVNGVQNNMKTLDLNSIPLDDTYLYLDYSDLIHIFFLKHPYMPFDFDELENCYCSIPLNSNITYRYSIQETYIKIADLLKKYI